MEQIKNYIIGLLMLVILLIILVFSNPIFIHEETKKPCFIEVIGYNDSINTDTTIILRNYPYKHFIIKVE